jgi:lipid II:glycine glycyltransferase (peptidoglycan interpeptide bridge formation enzyme)
MKRCDMTEFTEETWDRVVLSLPAPHVLQSWQWGQSKRRNGWQTIPLVWYAVRRDRGVDDYHLHTAPAEGVPAAAALVLARGLPLPGLGARLKVFYVPKGPLLADWGNLRLRARVLDDISEVARRHGAIFIKIDPDVRLGFGVPDSEDEQPNPLGSAVCADLRDRGWIFSNDQIQYRNTVLVDLTPDEDELLAAMKQKTRYNVRLAGRRGVKVRLAGLDDLELLYEMYVETSLRDGFAIRDRAYYVSLWSEFIQRGFAEGLIADVDAQAVAGILVFRFGQRAWYLYGMSRDAHREKMPNYLLQWEAIRSAKSSGCTSYDLWGAPDVFDPSNAMWGVYRFKDGLGGRVVRHIGAWDLPVRRASYWLYTHLLPKVLDWMRSRGISRTRRDALSGG